MRRGRRLAAVAALSLTLGACGGSGQAREATTARESPTTTQRETRAAWQVGYELWIDDLRAALTGAGTILSDREAGGEDELGEALDVLRDCAGFEERLGDAPRRLVPVRDLLARACERFARGADLAEEGDPADRLERALREWTEGSNLVQRANRRVARPQLLEELPIPAAGGLVEMSRVEPLLSRVADELAAPNAEVRCWDPPDWRAVRRETFGRAADVAGFASFEFNRANLAPEECAALAELAYSDRRPTGDEQLHLAFAVVVLMHEAGHLNEAGDFYGAGQKEDLAECWAMQHVRQAARRLGADARYAGELAERYWREVYPMVPAKYRSRKCRNGGEYDVRGETNVWP